MKSRTTDIPRLIFKMSPRTWSLTSGTNDAGRPELVLACVLFVVIKAPRSSEAKNAVGTNMDKTLTWVMSAWRAAV